MRAVSIADIEVVTRVLLAEKPDLRERKLANICEMACNGDRYRKRFGRQHVSFGNGTLMSAALQFQLAARSKSCGPEYLDCLALVVDRLRQ
ncbi:DUF7742 family protein [Yoonia sp. 2307UL14-13]|uniref:DUF7742 family protein n=1 Tax=Yoonia sp. 2307UL14-13 TaxID=3126506 RepID=UPI0030ECFA8C